MQPARLIAFHTQFRLTASPEKRHGGSEYKLSP